MPNQQKNPTEKRIIASFCALLSQRKHLDDIAVFEIAKKAQVSRTTFYNYFDSKQILIDETLNYIFDEVTLILNKDLLFDAKVMTRLTTYLHDNQSLILPVISFYPDVVEKTRKFIREVVLNSDIPNVTQKAEDSYHIPKEYAFELYIVTIQCILFLWIKNGFKESPEEIVTIILTSVRF